MNIYGFYMARNGRQRSGLIEMTNLDQPGSRMQKYRLTRAGIAMPADPDANKTTP